LHRSEPCVKLEILFDGIKTVRKIHWAPQKTFKKITADSRNIEKGDVFVACPGSRMNGHDFLMQAVQAEASVLVYEHLPEDLTLPPGVTGVEVQNSQACLTALLNRFHDFPDRSVKLIGTTGTNGKTTISYLLHQLLGRSSRTAYLGTLWYELPSQKISAPNTTPGPEVLIPLLADMRRGEVRYCVMEVSSHALHQSRVHGLEFELGIFTQLTQDHMDYHKTQENYFQAKRLLFATEPPPRRQLINRDCAFGRRLLKEYPSAASFSLEGEADYRAKNIEATFRGSSFLFCYKNREIPFLTRLPLRHNVANALAILGALEMLGYDPADFKEHFADIQGIPGRLERVSGNVEFDVFVDYAHTPDAFDNVLREARKFATGRILTVFGCGGDRDRIKRPQMTEIACRYSDEVILTTDNPRSEDPVSILKDMKTGISKRSDLNCVIHEYLDREFAIQEAVSMAQPGDVVLILGKGHEDYQILGDRKIPFDDRAVAREALQRKSRVFLS